MRHGEGIRAQAVPDVHLPRAGHGRERVRLSVFHGTEPPVPPGDLCTRYREGKRMRKEAEMPEDGRSAEEREVDWYRGRGYKQDRTKF